MAKDFIISVDSSCDEFKSVLEQKDVAFIPLTFYKDGMERFDDFTSNKDYEDFYDSLEKGKMPSFTAIDVIEFGKYFMKLMEGNDKDLIHISHSSGISACYDNAVQAAAVVMKKLPGRRIEIIDTLTCSRTMYLHTEMALQARFNGVSAEECAKNLRAIVPFTHQICVVGTLAYMKRVGCIVPGADAFFANCSGRERAIAYTNVRGEVKFTDKVDNYKAAYGYFIDYMKKNGVGLDKQLIYISHARAPEEAEHLRSLMLKEWPHAKVKIGWWGPLMGAQSGPGTIAICFIGKER